MENYQATDIVLIITAIGTAICSIIAALRANKASAKTDNLAEIAGRSEERGVENKERIAEIHSLVNGKSIALQKDFETQKRVCEELTRIVSSFIHLIPPENYAEALRQMKRVEAEIGDRRKEDFINKVLHEEIMDKLMGVTNERENERKG